MARCVRTALAAAALSLLFTAPAGAKLFTVTTDVDAPAAGAINDGICATASNGCTLRAAIQEANGTTGADEIALPARDYVLTTASELTVSSTVTINGESPRSTIVDAGGDSRVFEITGGSVVMNGLSVTGGSAAGGGGIGVSGSTELILDRVAVHGNTATGPSNQFGGGIDVFQGGLIVRHSAIYGNKVIATSNDKALGGGVFLNGTAMSATFDTVTIANNSATSDTGATFGGGVSSGDVPLTLRHVTMVGNTGGNVFSNDLSKVELENSVLAEPHVNPNCKGVSNAPVSHGVNLADDSSCSLPAGSPAGPAKLAALGDHGGPNGDTAPPMPGSPALDVATACPTTGTDQRGQTAPTGAGCDLGAAELGADLSSVLTASAASVDAGDSVTYIALLGNNGLDPSSGSLEFTPPAGGTVKFVSALGGSCAGSATVVCSHGALAAGESFAATIVVKAPASGPIVATARVSGPVADFDASNNAAGVTTAVVPAPPPPDTSDKTRPILGGLRLVGKLSRKKGGKLRSVLSENARLTIRLGRLGTQKRSGKAGEHTLKLSGRWGKKRPRRGRRYKLAVVATDAA